MKILAVTTGRKNGNGEILAKAALMRAEELGAEVKMINLHDYILSLAQDANLVQLNLRKKERKANEK
jgi:multimeric flavodoxin WrbA